jgi:predicted O-methyltransferase YrrM
MSSVEKLVEDTFGISPFTDFLPTDHQGFTHDIDVFQYLIELVRPEVIIEVGSWKGGSAIAMSKSLESVGLLKSKIVCVDTWAGSIEHWKNEKWKLELGLKNGYPTIYEKFMANLIRSGYEKFVIPLPMSSKMAAEYLKSKGVKADLIYIDAAHDYESVKSDLESYDPLLTSNGVLFGDDYPHRPVEEAAKDFAKSRNLSLIHRGRKFVLSKEKLFSKLMNREGFFKHEDLSDRSIKVNLSLTFSEQEYARLMALSSSRGLRVNELMQEQIGSILYQS